MKKSISFLGILTAFLLATAPATAEETVALEDLGALEEPSLEVLHEVHHRFLVSEIVSAGAKRAESAAKEAVKEAKKVSAAEEADDKAARAELNAAKKNNDDRRAQLAESLVHAATKDLDVAKAFLRWKEAAAVMQKQIVEQAKETMNLRQAEMELARAELVVQAAVVTKNPYRLDAFRKQVEERKKKVLDLNKKVTELGEKETEARQKWEQSR